MPTNTVKNRHAANHAHALVRVAGIGRLMESIGRETTELFLTEFAERLNAMARPGDDVIRIGADKFCLVLKDVKQRHHVELAAAKLVRVFEQPCELLDDKIQFDINAGLVLPLLTPHSGKDLIQIAESALRLAISTNQPYVIVEPDEVRSQRSDVSLLPRIERAFELGDFVLYYQVKVNAAHRIVTGAEALLRWHDSETNTVILPGAFIAVAEQASVISPMTAHIIKSAVGRCASWQSPLSIAVNVTPKLLETDELIPVISDALDVYALEPERLVIEVTERGVLPKEAFTNLDAIRGMGVKISIDDFGTGQCSLSYFRDLPADQVKIDRSFVQAMNASKKDLAIVNGILDLAHHCDMQVVAEGVEDEATADALTELGCDVLQGFWFGRPIPSDAFEIEHLQGLNVTDRTDDYFSSMVE